MYGMLTLDIQKRDKNIDLGKLRKDGMVPAVFYGPGVESKSISVPLIALKKILSEAGESTVIKLKGDGIDVDVLINDVDVHPVTEVPLHADFYAFDKTKTVEVSVPLEYIGVSPAVKDLGGMLMKVLHEIKVEALPSNLPHELTVDISSLVQFDDMINAKDIKLPAGVTLMEDPEETVVTVTAPREEKEEEVVPIDLSKIEVEKKGKKDEEAPVEESKE